MTATLTQNGAPVAGAPVSFAIGGDHSGTGSAITDADGKATFSYSESTVGVDTVTACSAADAGSVCSSVEHTWTNTPPDCSDVGTDLVRLWPPNHKLRLVTLSGGSDADGDGVTLAVGAVTQDEPLNGSGDGDTEPDAVRGADGNQVWLRAERSGTGDGRVYRVGYTLTDDFGAACSGAAEVAVPHDQSRAPVDSAPPGWSSFG